MMERALEYFITKDNKIAARKTVTGEFIKSQDFAPYFFLSLGKRIPQNIYKSMIEELKNDFVSNYGLSSEKLSSPKFKHNNLMRGGIWWHGLIIVEGIDLCGEHNFAKSLAEKYCKCILKSGFTYSYNVDTGEGEHIKNCSMSTATFIYFHNKYLS